VESLISVALQFDPNKHSAPEIIASGEGELGDLVRKIAEKHSIPIVKDPMLASTLVKIPVGQEIPEKLYQAVVKIYQFIYKIEKDLRPKE
jgi:flagellar biosynthesis protein